MRSTKTKADTVVEFETSSERVREVMESVGSKIGNVHFYKKSDGSLRKMSYRLGVRNPKHLPPPIGNGNNAQVDIDRDMITVYSTNDLIRDINGNVIGRGAWRRVPLENVVRVVANGKVYQFQRTD